MSLHPLDSHTRPGRITALLGIALLACNLRVAVASVGPVLSDLARELHVTSMAAGILTSLPVISFAAFGALAPRICAAFGLHRTTLVAVVVSAAALGCRALVPNAIGFFGFTVLALAGIAVANIVMPSLVKMHFPDRVGLVTAVYTTALALGLTLATSMTVPVAAMFGSWRWGLGAWSLTMATAIVPWLSLAWRGRGESAKRAPSRAIGLRAIAGTRTGWVLALAFAAQSALAYSIFGWFPHLYQDAGFSPAVAGFLVGAITAVGIPVSFAIPWLAVRLHGYGVLGSVLVTCYVIGFVGLAAAPQPGAWLWAIAIGIGQATFPMILTLIALRARTANGTAALSGFSQSVGYLLAAPVPILIGTLYGETERWVLPLAVMAVLAVVLFACCALAAKPGSVEDEVYTPTLTAWP